MKETGKLQYACLFYKELLDFKSLLISAFYILKSTKFMVEVNKSMVKADCGAALSTLVKVGTVYLQLLFLHN